MYFVEDEHFARNLQNELNIIQDCKRERETKEKENLNPVDSHLEYIDPTPSIHDLFVRFDKKFFWSSLGMVEVKWSTRMTSCAGVCYFQGKRGLCHISLSAPLLSLRPRKDLVETLLHEMIHAYLFITNNYRDRDDHGPEFHKHMFRINKEAGTNITVCHSFFDEVHYYQKHIWRCNGPCKDKKPYFGFVRRAVNRKPGPSDNWWNQHKIECNGTFIKISEPEKNSKKSKITKGVISKRKSKDIRDFLSVEGSTSLHTKVQKNSSNNRTSNMTYADLNLNKPAAGIKVNKGSTKTVVLTNTNNRISSDSCNKESKNVHTNDKINKVKNTQLEFSKSKTKNTPVNDLNQGQVSDGIINNSNKRKEIDKEDVREVVRNVWANKFITNLKICDEPSCKKSKIQCPVCVEGFSEEEIEFHVEGCLQLCNRTEENNCKETGAPSTKKEFSKELKKCPICGKEILKSEMNEHLEICLNCSFDNEKDNEELEDEVVCQSVPCPCCYQWFLESEMNSHIDDCLTIATLKAENVAF